MIINTNLASMNTIRQLGINEKATQSSLAKLSSGLKINSAADDAAGLSISEKMRGQISGLNQASSNAQTGINMVSTAEGALNESTSILQRMRELAVQAGNDTNTTTDRGAMQTEMNQLTSEINRIGNTTQFNTQNLLKGTNAAAVTTAQAVTTVSAGVTGVATGSISDFTVNAKSVAAVASSTFVQGNTANATGAIGATAQTTNSVAGKDSTAIAAELTFTSTAKGTALNGDAVNIVQSAQVAAGVAQNSTIAQDAVTGAITISIGTDAAGNSLLGSKYTDPNAKPTVGDLYTAITTADNYATSGFTVNVQGVASADTLANYKSSVTSDTNLYSTSFAGGVNETNGVNTFSITSAVKEAGDTITVGGQTFTGVSGAADATKGQFSVVDGNAAGATDIDSQAASLFLAIAANSSLSTRFDTTDANTVGPATSGAAAGGIITLVEKDGQATGKALAAVTTAGAGTNNDLIVSDGSGNNLKTITLASDGGATPGTGAVATCPDNADGSNSGGLLITLGSDPNQNTAAAIQAAVQKLGVVALKDSTGTATGQTVDFGNYTFKSTGNWDAEETGSDITSPSSTIVGGTSAVKGDYSFDVTKPFAAGDQVTIKGQTFTAVDGSVNSVSGSAGQFDISGGTDQQAASLSTAIGLNSVLGSAYSTANTGSTIEMTENVASGADMKANDLKTGAAGTQGQYTVNVSDLMTNGASLVLDGQSITASNKTSNVGYDNGTAIKVAGSVAEQTNALADAINKNATLSANYNATVDGSGNLVLAQTAAGANTNAPQVSTVSSTSGDFSAKLQIGANSGQTMTIDISDMRSVALGISGNGSSSTVKANDGSVASYVAVADVSNGTDNNNTEFGLDISTADKATAAISVIDDATNAVSAERSNLGAYQNRLEHTINNLGTSSQNITTAEANIRDVDMASEMTNFQKNNILQQAAQAMLAQANQQPQGVLQLLR